MTIEELRARHKKILADMDGVDAELSGVTHTADGPSIAADEVATMQTKFDALDGEAKTVSTAIKRAHARQEQHTAADTLLPALTSRSGPPIDAAILDETERVIAEQSADRTGFHNERLAIPAVPKRWWGGELEAFKGPDADGQAYRAGMFLLSTLAGNDRATQYCRDHGLRSALSGDVNSAGGVFVPDEFEIAIIRNKELFGKFRPNTRVTPMARDTKDIPRRTGGHTVFYVGENQEITESQPTYNNVKLVTKKPSILTRMSSEIAEDAVISMADEVTQEASEALAQAEDDAGFAGDGGSSFGGMTGVINAMGSASKFTTAAGSLAFADVLITELEGVMATLPEFALDSPNCKWYISTTGNALCFQSLANALGGNTIQSFEMGMARMFQGFPVVITQSLHNLAADIASTVIILFGDLKRASTMGVRRGITVQVSDQRYFEFDQIGIKFTQRHDIVVHDAGDDTTAGAIVGLATPAS